MKVRKLTPSVLKKIIAEEKQKIVRKKRSNQTVKQTQSKNKKSLIESKIDEVTKLALQEAKLVSAIKKIRAKRKRIKSSVSKLSK